LHTPALQTGTHFLLTLEKIVFLFHLLSAISKPFSFLSTRLAHAARFGFFFFTKTRYINSLLLLLTATVRVYSRHLAGGNSPGNSKSPRKSDRTNFQSRIKMSKILAFHGCCCDWRSIIRS